jgi:flagellar biosynthetic protein FlhB
MAGAGEDKTEAATPKKRQDAREKGQVARSFEINGAAGLLVGIATLKAIGPFMINTWEDLAIKSIQSASYAFDNGIMVNSMLIKIGLNFMILALPIAVAGMFTAIISNMMQVGMMYSQKALAWDFSKLNPFQGIARMFSTRAMVEVLKSAIKSIIIGYVVYSFFKNHGMEIVRIITTDPLNIGNILSKSVFDLLLNTGYAIIGLAIFDYAYQKYDFEKNLKMTKQEVKEEYKSTEGDPQLKMRIRQKMRDMARRRMMTDVKSATVVITNPTHIAVALKYDFTGKDPAPKIVAKGERKVAEKIKEVARAAGIPVIENKPLARALNSQCNIGDIIPSELYQAVAEVLAFIFKQTGRTIGGDGRIN